MDGLVTSPAHHYSHFTFWLVFRTDTNYISILMVQNVHAFMRNVGRLNYSHENAWCHNCHHLYCWTIKSSISTLSSPLDDLNDC